MEDYNAPTVGSEILTPDGPRTIVEEHLASDELVLDDGTSWFMQDLYRIEMPPLGDDQAISEWLAAPSYGVRRPRKPHMHDTARCMKTGLCECQQCYAQVFYDSRGEQLSIRHFADNEVCQCMQGNCPCVR